MRDFQRMVASLVFCEGEVIEPEPAESMAIFVAGEKLNGCGQARSGMSRGSGNVALEFSQKDREVRTFMKDKWDRARIGIASRYAPGPTKVRAIIEVVFPADERH